MQDVAEHRGPEDAWMVIHGQGEPNSASNQSYQSDVVSIQRVGISQ